MLRSLVRFYGLATRPYIRNVHPSTVLGNTVNTRGKKSRAKKEKAKIADDSFSEDASSLDLLKYEKNMKQTIDALQSNYARLRTDGASPSILDDIKVDAYGAKTSLQSLAQVSVKDGRTLMVSVFDDATAGAVEKAIRSAGIGLNPVSEGGGRMRIPVPKPSQETRMALKETASKEAESAKVAARMIRRKAMEEVKKLKDDISKDDSKRLEKNVQALTDKYVDIISETCDNKLKAIEQR